jgi:DNA-binding NtrC family response regulator
MSASPTNSSAHGIARTGVLRWVERQTFSRDTVDSTGSDFGRMIGGCASMQRVFRLCERLAPSNLTLTIEGETGTGKELLALVLHEMGPRKTRPLVVLDCAAVRGDELTRLLFGESSRAWLTEQVAGGTLVLDDVTELTDEAQSTLVRFLDRCETPARGAPTDEPIVRLIATSRQSLDEALRTKRFREELFFRITASRISLPPLRERGSDVELIAERFWAELAPGQRFSGEVLSRYANYKWSGNVRELRNVIQRSVELGTLADEVDVPPVAASATMTDDIETVLNLDLPLGAARARIISVFEGRYVARVLERTGGNVSHSAKRAGVARRYFQILRARSVKGSPAQP